MRALSVLPATISTKFLCCEHDAARTLGLYREVFPQAIVAEDDDAEVRRLVEELAAVERQLGEAAALDAEGLPELAKRWERLSAELASKKRS